MAEAKVRVVRFPETAIDTVECVVTGQEIPAVLVAEIGKVGWVHCPHCTARRKERIWHSVDLLFDDAPSPQTKEGGG